MTRRAYAIALTACVAGAVLAAPPSLPTPQELEKILLRDKPHQDLFQTGCQAIDHTWPGAEDSEFDYENPFRTVLRFLPGKQQSVPARQVLRESRALARAGLLAEEPIAGGGTQFRFTVAGWGQIRPLGRMCVIWGTNDQVRVTSVRPSPSRAPRKVEFAYTLGYSTTGVLEPWARDPAVRRDLDNLTFYIQPQSFEETAVESNGQWALERAQTPVTAAAPITPDEVLRLALASIPEARNTVACFPLPATRPQLGIEVGNEGGYEVRVRETAELNTTQRKFIAEFLEQLADWERSGILKRTSPRSFRLADKLRDNLRGACLLVGSLAPRLVKTSISIERPDRSWFKLMLEPSADPVLAKAQPAVMAQKDVRQFLARGVACEGLLRYSVRWTVGHQRCYPPY